MQFSRVKLSMRSKGVLGILRARTGLTPNILARYGLCLSLKDPSSPNPEEFNELGNEMLPSVLFGEHEKMYLALMLERLHKDKLAPEVYLQNMMRAHVNRGVLLLTARISDLSDFYELVKEERRNY